MGILSLIKSFTPLVCYLAALFFVLRALTGRVQWTMALLVFLLPLRNVIDRIQQFPLGSQIINVLVLSIIFGWIVSSAKNSKFLEKSSLNAISIILIFYICISLLIGNQYLYGSFALDIHDSRVQDCKNFCLLPILFFLTLNTIRDKKWVWLIFTAMCLAMVLMSYYTTSQIREYSSLLSREKISGTFQFLGPNEVAAFLNQFTIVLLSVYFFMKKSRNKILLLALILLNIYCIIFLYSRGAYLGLGVGLFFLFAFKNKKLLIPLLIVFALWQKVLPEKAIERIKGTITYGELDESSKRRVQIWEQAIALFEQNAIVGIGFGSFRELGLDLGDTHNIYIKILLEQGIIGFIIFLGVIFCFIKEGFILYQKGDDDLSKGLGLGFAICILVLLVNNFFGDRWAYLEVSAYLWIFAGLVSRLNAIAKDPLPIPTEKQTVPKGINSPIPQEKPKKKVRYYDL